MCLFLAREILKLRHCSVLAGLLLRAQPKNFAVNPTASMFEIVVRINKACVYR